MGTGQYFDTPPRAERLQLLLHLLRNASDVIYLRAPAGGGKTTFVHRLLDILGEDMVTVWLRAGRDADVVAAVADQLGLGATGTDPWPEAVLAGVGERELLVVVDDADHLALASVEHLATLHAGGGQLLLVGQGGLAQTARNWDVQFVDLPPFDVPQTAAFLRRRAGSAAPPVSDELVGALHQATHGWPGPLLDAFGRVASGKSRAAKPTVAPSGRSGPPIWTWIAGGAIAVMLAAVLMLQDTVNTLFEPADPASLQTATLPPPAHPGEPVVYFESRAPESGPPDSAATDSSGVAETAAGDTDQGSAGGSFPGHAPALTGLSLDLEPEPAAGGPAADAVESLIPPIPALGEPPAPTSPPASEAASVGDDPLEAVMRDAISAAEAAGDRAEAGGVASEVSGTVTAPVEAMAVATPTPSEKVGEVNPRRAAPGLPSPSMPASTVGTPAVRGAVPGASTAVVTTPPAVVVAPPPAPARSVAEVVEVRPDDRDPGGPAPVEERSVPRVPTQRAADRRTEAATGDRAVPAPVETRATANGPPVDPARPVEPSTPVPAPVEDRTRPRSAPDNADAKALGGDAAEEAPLKTVVSAAPAADAGVEWLKSRRPDRYTLQLLGARNKAAVQAFARDHGVAGPYAIFERPLDGRAWYSLVAGDYADRDEAIKARDRLPAGIGPAGIWPRTFESIQKTLN